MLLDMWGERLLGLLENARLEVKLLEYMEKADV
jgi:hypothetical protein